MTEEKPLLSESEMRALATGENQQSCWTGGRLEQTSLLNFLPYQGVTNGEGWNNSYWVGCLSANPETIYVFDPAIQYGLESSLVRLFDVSGMCFEIFNRQQMRLQITPVMDGDKILEVIHRYDKLPVWMRPDFDYEYNFYYGELKSGRYMLFDLSIQVVTKPYIFLFGMVSRMMHQYLPNEIRADLRPVTETKFPNDGVVEYRNWKDQYGQRFLQSHRVTKKAVSQENRIRPTHCYLCQERLSNLSDAVCAKCGWSKCPYCGACGCRYHGWQEEYDSFEMQVEPDFDEGSLLPQSTGQIYRSTERHQAREKDVRKGNGVRHTHCYQCREGLNNLSNVECARCGWIKCPHCGACGCGYHGWWEENDPFEIHEEPDFQEGPPLPRHYLDDETPYV